MSFDNYLRLRDEDDNIHMNAHISLCAVSDVSDRAKRTTKHYYTLAHTHSTHSRTHTPLIQTYTQYTYTLYTPNIYNIHKPANERMNAHWIVSSNK